MAKISPGVIRWAVEQVLGGRTPLDVSKEVGTTERAVRNWVNQWKHAVIMKEVAVVAPKPPGPPPPAKEEKKKADPAPKEKSADKVEEETPASEKEDW